MDIVFPSTSKSLLGLSSTVTLITTSSYPEALTVISAAPAFTPLMVFPSIDTHPLLALSVASTSASPSLTLTVVLSPMVIVIFVGETDICFGSSIGSSILSDAPSFAFPLASPRSIQSLVPIIELWVGLGMSSFLTSS